MKHKKKLIKSAKARVTGTIPYCHGKVPHSRKLLSLCSNDFKGGITPTKFRGSKFPGNMHNYIWCPYYLPSFMKFCSVVSEELC
jgi:hypothetical protein